MDKSGCITRVGSRESRVGYRVYSEGSWISWDALQESGVGSQESRVGYRVYSEGSWISRDALQESGVRSQESGTEFIARDHG